ncbi:MAG: FAD binding domain-containing protein [Chloroflexota bacterium]
MWQTYYQPASLDEALQLLRQHGAGARIVAGGTDVLVELGRGVRPTATLVDITRLPGLKAIRREGDTIRIGALATHNDVIASADCVRDALPLAQACLEIGAPPIRTRATVAGNLVTASPANDTIAPLLALDAELVLASLDGERTVRLADFYPGFRQTALRPDELVREIRFRALRPDQRGLFLKLGLRRAQAISVINIALVVTFDSASGGDAGQPPAVKEARVALGALAPTVIRAPSVEAFLAGKRLDPEVCAEAGRLACADARPIDDVRGSAAYRLAALANLVADGLARIAAGREREGWPERVVLLETPGGAQAQHAAPPQTASDEIVTTVNGSPVTLSPRKTLLDALREDAGLTGTKEGCAEGECGACTVWLGGQAVMACLTPAAQARGTPVTTIEGLAATAEALHPLQRAFIEHGAVQCGYCIPGMIMAGAKLLEEIEAPGRDEVRVALSGNICRCTGYRKILDAVQAAAGDRAEG